MTEQSNWTRGEVRDAFQTALAMALAADRDEPATVGELWNGSTNKPALIWVLARIPGVLMRTVAADAGRVIDVEVTLAELLPRFAATDTPQEDQ